MAKISLISCRRQKKKFPETEAQRLAWTREQRTSTAQSGVPAEAVDVLRAAPPCELFEFDEGHLIAAGDFLALFNSNRLHDVVEEIFDAPAEFCVSVDLTVAQSHALLALPLYSWYMLGPQKQTPPMHSFNSANRRIIER